MRTICLGCNKSFARRDILKRHLIKNPSHSKLTIPEVFREYNIPKSPITDALCNADLVHLPIADPKRLELFGDYVPRISSVENWKSTYSFEDMRRITLGDLLRSNTPIGIRINNSFSTIINNSL